MYRWTLIATAALMGTVACRLQSPQQRADSAAVTVVTDSVRPPEPIPTPPPPPALPLQTTRQSRPRPAITPVAHTGGPNTTGRIPILEYHLIGEKEGRWERHYDAFRRDLELLYERGYRPVTISQLVDGDLRLAAGHSPVVFTFDDASPSQFRYIERPDGTLEIDPTSAVGIWLEFNRRHPDWENRAVFCLLSGAEAGRSFFGDKNIEGQKTGWRHRKVRFLADQGFELCNHTLWHANLGKYSDEQVQEQIARGVLAIDSAVPGYRVRTFALPLGVWPKTRELAQRGSWRDPRSGRTVTYDFDAVLMVAGNPVPSPTDPAFDPLKLERVQVLEGTIERVLATLDRTGQRYVSAGPAAVTVARRPRQAATTIAPRER